MTASMLAEITDTSKRTILRDMKDLESMGCFITADRNGYTLVESTIRYQAGLLDRELFDLMFSRMLFKKTVTEEKSNYRNKQRSNMEGNWFTFINERIVHYSLYRDKYDKNIIKSIGEAMKKKRSIVITYYSPSSDIERSRKVDPYYLLDRDEHYYLIAYCHIREGYRSFRIDRIKKTQILKEAFRMSDDFSITDYLAKWRMDSHDSVEKFVVRFSSKVAKYIQEKQFDDKNAIMKAEEDGSVLLTIKTGKQTFLKWIRKYGIDAEVLEPRYIREQLKEEYSVLLKRYE